MNEDRVKVGVVAADPMRSFGLEAILQESAGLDAAAMSLEQAASQNRLGALLIDRRCCGDALTEIIVRLRQERPEMKIIVVGESLDFDVIQSVIGAGAKGYLHETAGEREICMAMEVVLDGSVWAPRKVLSRLIDAGGITQPNSLPPGEGIANKMTPREKDVLIHLMEGRSNRAIAEALGVDEVTIKAHLGRMLRKTGSSNRVELSLRAAEELAANAEGEDSRLVAVPEDQQPENSVNRRANNKKRLLRK